MVGHIKTRPGPHSFCHIWPRPGPDLATFGPCLGRIMFVTSGPDLAHIRIASCGQGPTGHGPCLAQVCPGPGHIITRSGPDSVCHIRPRSGIIWARSVKAWPTSLSAPFCRNWPRPGPDVATSGPGLAQIIILELGQIWPKPGPDSARPEPRSGPYLVCHIWPRSGIVWARS